MRLPWPFHYICRLSDFSLIKLFLDCNANPDLQNKVDPNIRNSNGDTSFHFICRNIAQGRFAINQIERFFEKNEAIKEANANIQNDKGNTPYHDLINGEYRQDFIELFLKHGARSDISNNDGITPYELGLKNPNIEQHKDDFRALHNKNRNWHYIKNHNRWQEYQENFPEFIKTTFCYCASNKLSDKFIQKNRSIITMVTIHDINEQGNEAYYDPENLEFAGVMKFAQGYIETYNQKKKLKKKPEKIEFLHLIPFSWHNNLLHSAEQLAEYLDTKYRNSRLIFLARGFGCDVANLTSQRLGYLDKINKMIKEDNAEIPDDDKKKLYKGRIKLLLYFAPSCRLKIPEEAKSWFINFLGTEYDRMNDAISTRPTNYNLLISFYSPNDEEIKPSAFNDEMKTLATRSISVGIGVGALTSYALCRNENIATSEGRKKLLFGVMIGGTILSYPILVSYNKKKTIDSLPYHRYENVVPINELTDDSFTIEGPKIQIKTMVDGNLIGHSVPELLQNLRIIFNILKTQYFTELACSRSFCINVNTNQGIQGILQYLGENKDRLYKMETDRKGKKIAYKFDDNRPEIKDEFKFWKNRKDNCKVQCWFDEDYKSEVVETDESLYFYWAKIKKTMGTDDRDGLVNQAKRIAASHKHIFEYIKALQ